MDMNSVVGALRRTKTITFDCYGTLIDWRAGLGRSFQELFGSALDDRMQEMFDAYVALEAEVEAERFRPYRRVLAETAERLARRFDLALPAGDGARLAEMLPEWPPFADSREALLRLRERYRLGVLSNVDRDLFAQSAHRLDVAFDLVITAEDVGAYKPRPAHFERLLREHGPRETVMHAGQSLFHDGAAAERLGIAYVWINRYNDSNTTAVTPLAEFPDVRSFTDVACAV